ncbi:MAG: hypothetical protein LLG13_07725 [Bacteroidales bacterium]|nr:hypothetical protein [Bacteroidales bacterium]
MKKFFTLLAIVLLPFNIFAQSPQKMSYQFVVRNAGGALVTDHGVGLKISILQGTATGTVVYQEIFNPNPQTNSNGLASVEIGSGLPVTGTFSSINWAAGPYFLKTETDPTGATDYTIVGTSQLLSVPYAFYSKMAGDISDNSVTSARITDGTVSTNDLADGSVTTAKILDGTIATQDLANYSVTSGKIANNSIYTNALADNIITSVKILDGNVNTADLASSAVTAAKISGSGAIADQVLQYNGSAVTWGYAPGSLINTSFLAVPYALLGTSSTNWTKIGDIGTISKLDATSDLDVTFNGRVYVGTLASSAIFEIRIDAVATTTGWARAYFRSTETSGMGIPASMTGIFTGLSAGYHTVSMWVRVTSGTGSDATMNPGNFQSDHVIVREFK